METVKGSGNFKTRILLIILGIILIAAASLWGLSDNIPAIIVFLAGWFIFFFGIVFSSGRSKELTWRSKLLYWSPRMLSIVFLLFMALFALDVFSESRGFWETALALTMHLIPSILMAAILIISWKREWIGAVLFPALGIYYILTFWDRHFMISVYLMIAGPLFLIGILFFLNWKQRSTMRPLH